jgi:peptide chain release factor 3
MEPLIPGKQLEREIQRRRTFAIISHPDAGKTTLTEKLLLYGGAIHLAGAVKAKSNSRKTTSDWMEIEKQRGISISTTVLRFEYNNFQINLLDTPGHKDFSEDTYRTLVAADAAVMLIDAAKGVEPQTLKLFEVCRMRGLPIFTFINKMDRPARDPLELIDELEKVLGIRSSPISWPIGMGDRFKGVYDRQKEEVLLFQAEDKAHASKQTPTLKVGHIAQADLVSALNPPENKKEELLELQQEVQSQLELLEIAGDPYDSQRVLKGELTPVFFGSAMNNFGVQHFLDKFLEMAPAPTGRQSNQGTIEPSASFSGVFFKIQANIDPQHRDRVSFFRVCSGKFSRGMEATHGRLKQNFKLNKAFHFFAQERNLIEEAWPGDIVGFLDTTGDFRIGDTLCSDKIFEYEGVPRFSPENFAGVSLADPLKRKQLKKGLDQLSEEGVVQIFRSETRGDAQPILGVVGALQFDVLQHRIKTEYSVDMRLERLGYSRARWLAPQESGKDISKELMEFSSYADCLVVKDRDSLPVILFKTDWSMNWAVGKYPNLKFLTSAPLALISAQN